MPLEPRHKANRPPAALTGTEPHGRGTAVNNTKPRVVVYVSTDHLLAFLTAALIFAMFVFVGLASNATNESVQQMTAQGTNAPAVSAVAAVSTR